MITIKHNSYKALLLCVLLARAAAHGAVGFVVSPETITNDFVGQLTLSITNLTPGQTIDVRAYADLNGNGLVDPGEPIIINFPVTDGQMPTIGGVRNVNLPGDEDGTPNGQIAASWSLPYVDGNPLPGKLLLQIVDSKSNIALATQPYTISAHALPQGMTGRITDAATGLPLPHVIVGIVRPPEADLPYFATTDANGNYSCPTLPDSYAAIAIQSGYISTIRGNNVVPVSCGQMTTNNVSFASGTLVISGKVIDNITGLGIPGILVTGRANTLAVTQAYSPTDANGSYVLKVSAPNQWGVQVDKDAASFHGYVPITGYTAVTVTSANVPNVNITLTNATALIYGAVTDDSQRPVSGLLIAASDPNSFYAPRGRTIATNGNYCIGVMAGTNWAVAPNSSELSARGYAIPQVIQIKPNAGQATRVDIALTRDSWPSLTSPASPQAGQFQFLFSGLVGQNYTIQASSAPSLTDWFDILTTNATCDAAQIIDNHATNALRFYRAIAAP